ncbi:MAG TPA: amidohydrolase family protein [Albitalea sp.]
MKRRRALGCCAALGAGLFTGLAARDAHALALRNPCRGPLPPALARHDIVLQALDGIAADALCDVHAHLLGIGDAGSGCTIHPNMQRWWRPLAMARRLVMLDAACVPSNAASVDLAYVDRLRALADAFPAGARWLLLAFDQACDDDGRPRPDWTTFFVPNAYAAQVAARHADRFDWVASVHPYREDALHRLDTALAQGAVAVKWLPSAMNIDVRDPRCRPFYERLARAGVPLGVHCGEEQAAPGAGREGQNNPLLVRHVLQAGVRVIVAHAATLGRARDLDRPSQPWQPAFDLWARLMDEPDAREHLFADLSAAFQVNRTPAARRTLLQRDDWHPRLLHGSDYPLPGVMPLYAPARLADEGLLDRADVDPLLAVRAHNPLLFDFVLKRRLRAGTARFPRGVFETRPTLRRWRAAT